MLNFSRVVNGCDNCFEIDHISLQALTPPIRLYPPNAGPILPGMLGPAALGAQANVAAVAAGASAAAIQAAYDSSSESLMCS